MKKILTPIFAIYFASGLFAQSKPIEGRWDLTLTKDGKAWPSWLEVRHSGVNTLVGRFVYAFGSAPHLGSKVEGRNV